jgi:ribonuclease HI
MFNLQTAVNKYGASFKCAFVYPGIDSILSNDQTAVAEFKKLCKETLKMDYFPKSPAAAAEMFISYDILPIDPTKTDPVEMLAKYKVAENAEPPSFPKVCYAFTDGGSYRNGKPGAIASFAAVFQSPGFKTYSHSGMVQPFEYEAGRPIRPTLVGAAPSNNRGELLGFMYGLLLIKKYGLMSESAFLISDSEYSIKTVTQYYPTRLKKRSEGELKNLDLLKIIYPLYEELGRLVSLTVLHVRSHQKTSACNKCEKCENCTHRQGNELADKLAGMALLGQPTEYIESLNNI